LDDFLLQGKIVGIVFEAGTDTILSADSQRTGANTAYSKVKEIQVYYGGTINVYFELMTADASYPAYGRIYKNGVAVGTERVCSVAGSYVSYDEDISVQKDDLLQLYTHGTGGASWYCRNFRLRLLSNPLGGVITD
jgi:2-phospho-L-lactate guanylyltransferase (CobY/MobA/RfbA family)